ncbi:MAG: hypothetical protein KGS72_18695 [Cyanobacteria bacterium REEB67]|nr:hypothetical protein [Cyanobacteria bacterium REEB67]
MIKTQTHRSGWLIQGKDNRYYKNDADNCHSSAAWIKSDLIGDRLNARGQKVKTVAQAEHIKSVAKWAKYPPATDYFTNPTEEVAEGLMMYRLSTDDRHRLLEKKPQLYWAVKEHDQAEINNLYGQDDNGRAKLIRGVDGFLVSNNSTNEAAVAKLEGKKGLSERPIQR